MASDSRWSLIERAGAGDPAARSDFTSRYLPLVRGWLLARWRGRRLVHEVEDAVQDVFFDLLRVDGALARAQDRGTGFRGFLYGVTLHVARRKELELDRNGRKAAADTLLATLPGGAATPTALLDHDWAVTVMRDALLVQGEDASRKGDAAVRRVELLRVRFHDDLPIREIARLWKVDPDWLHHQLEQAKKEFQRAWCSVMGLQGASEEQVAAAWREFLQLFARGRGAVSVHVPEGAVR